jgi:hypothetical protein
MDGGGGAGEVVNLVNFEANGFGDVVAEKFEVGMTNPFNNVTFASGVEII